MEVTLKPVDGKQQQYTVAYTDPAATTSFLNQYNVPYDATSTWLKGADRGPEAIIEASSHLELFDIETAMTYMTWYLDESLFGMRVQDVVRTVDDGGPVSGQRGEDHRRAGPQVADLDLAPHEAGGPVDLGDENQLRVHHGPETGCLFPELCQLDWRKFRQHRQRLVVDRVQFIDLHFSIRHPVMFTCDIEHILS